MEKLALHFGAGNIGRGFIGMLLAQSGYRVIFVDIANELVDSIQQRGAYRVEIAGENLESVLVENVEARLVSAPDLPELLATAELISTAVGPNMLAQVAEIIVSSFSLFKGNLPQAPQYIIACENMIRASSRLKDIVEKLYGEDLPSHISFCDAAVDRVVPLMKQKDILTVRVEQYHEWLVEGGAEENPTLVQIDGLKLVPNLTPYLKRKIYIVNTGHACTAWHGFRLGYTHIDEALKDEHIYSFVFHALAESIAGLCSEYGLALEEQQIYYNNVLKRFQNPYIVDDVLRVGRQPLRKLGKEERIDGPLQLGQKHGHSVDSLLYTAAVALLFRNEQDAEACQLQEILQNKGLDILCREKLAHFGSENLEKIKQYYRQLIS